MISHHVTCHGTAVSCASSLSKRKEKEKENKNCSCPKHTIIVSQVVQYKEQVEEQKIEEVKLVKVEGVKE